MTKKPIRKIKTNEVKEVVAVQEEELLGVK
jgi:hypothetical protein